MDDKKKENWIAIQKTLYPQNNDEKIRISYENPSYYPIPSAFK